MSIDARLAHLERMWPVPDRCPDCPIVPGLAIVDDGEPEPLPVTCATCGRVHVHEMLIVIGRLPDDWRERGMDIRDLYEWVK
jgi:hypothetical protein